MMIFFCRPETTIAVVPTSIDVSVTAQTVITMTDQSPKTSNKSPNKTANT